MPHTSAALEIAAGARVGMEDSFSPRLEKILEKCVWWGGGLVFFVMYIGRNRENV